MISTEITRLQNAKAALKTAINAKNDSSHQIDDETLEDYAEFVDNISTGGGGGTVQEAPSKDVNFYDYDGKILYSYTASEFTQLTEMPANPTHSGWTSKGWNWSLTDAKTQVTNTGKCDIGQMYRVTDGKTRLYCHFNNEVKSFYLGVAPNGTVTIDWGDGSATSTLTGTSRSTIKDAQHTYATAGDYVITLSISSGGTYAFTGGSNYTYLFRKSSISTSYLCLANAACLKKAYLGEGVYLGNYAFNYCSNLKEILLPDNLGTSLGTCILSYCYGLQHVTIPNQITSIGNYSFRYDYGFRSISLPKGITSIGTSAFLYNQSLTNISLPPSLTSIQGTTFQRCYALSKLTIPANVTSIAANAFQDCYGMKEYHFKSTTVPTLDNANAFTNMQSDCVIYVPSAKLNNYKTASNWSTYASQMVGE